MKATEAKLLSFLQKSPQFIIPIYQRTYSWTEKQCRQLWDDIMRAGSSASITVHFIGSIVYVEQGLSQVSHQAPLLVIDGQQRLTTVSLLLEALARALGDTEPVEGFSAAKIRHYYLSNPLEAGDRFYKLLLSQTDKETLNSIIRNSEPPKESSLRVTNNFSLFSDLITEQSDNLETICRGLAKLIVVDIALSRDQDNPQLIFESMNSTGKELSQADLIRNYILMGLDPTLQSRLYQDYWRPMELDFGQEAYGDLFDSFMRHYLTVRTGDIPRERDVYEAFKEYSRTKPVQEAGIEALVEDIRVYTRYYCAMSLGSETDPQLKTAFQDLRELKVDVAFPLLLELYHDYDNKILPSADFVSAIRMIESYVFRRAICSIPTNSMNKTFATFGKSLKKDRYLESMQAHFLRLPSYRRFPNDEEFRRDLLTRDLYHFPRNKYWLRKIENQDRKETVNVDEFTIEHILPQNPELSPEWKQALGSDWENTQQQYLHTLGNLTLTGYNAEYSDRSFTQKRDIKGGFKESPLKLNVGLGQLESWNETTIKERANRLADQALSVWTSPNLDSEILASYLPQKIAPVSAYTIEDHPHLTNAVVSPLFEAFRKEVLALNPCVTEEFMKLYVAYKAETNFVDVVPQSKRLRLALNMNFTDIHDPRGLCKDVTNLGRWGNGDVEVVLDSLDGLSYIMSLVRQSYERQMGEGGGM